MSDDVAHQTTRRRPNSARDELSVEVKPRGPDPAGVEDLWRELARRRALAELLAGTRHRLIDFELLDGDGEAKPRRPPASPTHFRATVFDYTNDRTIRATGAFADLRGLRAAVTAAQPVPSVEEFDEAVALLRRATGEPELATAARDRRLYAPMPPLVPVPGPDGRSERIVTVGVLPDGGRRHEIVGVNLSRRRVLRFEGGAPPNALALPRICGLPGANQQTASGAPGQAWVTVKKGSQVLWRFLAVRPAASSGTNGSGIELRFVDYKGKRVLYRAHVPILNVKYDGDACGPYRDWQNEEGMLQADGVDVAPGFRLCPAPATTVLDTGVDAGNFLGVAIWVEDQEVVLASEMEAGWYRYISEWRLGADGAIRARFGFGAVDSSCVCNVHHHHAYWRLDFDIETPDRNRVREHNELPLIGKSKWHTLPYEVKRFRDPARKRRWLVENVDTKAGYEIVPGPTDGVATAAPDWDFPRGDLWLLRYRPDEIDDGSVATGPPYEAELDRFVTGEWIEGKDVVVWYGAHFSHDVTHDEPGHFGHVVGPTLRPVRW